MFIVPPSSVDPAELPPPIRTSDAGSFARFTFVERIPGILREALAANDWPDVGREALGALLAEVTEGRIGALGEETPDRSFWNSVSAPHLGRSWLDVPWYWAEAFLYRRLLEATGYFRPGPGQRVDPFAAKKDAELAPDAAPGAANALLAALPDDPTTRFEMLLHASLWGNRSDLSYETAARLGRPTGTPEERSNLLVDDTGPVWDLLRRKGCARLAILADNAGTELLMDLALADYLLCQDLVEEVQLHVKPHPFFVSDATGEDVSAAVDALASAGGAAGELARRLGTQMARGDLRLVNHWFYGTSLFYFELPPDLRDLLGGMDLVVAKGDVNYRRLLGDAHWPPTTSFVRATRYFPAPLVALRTLKGEIIVGLEAGEAERLRKEDPAWLINGRRGVVQARL